MVPDQIVSTVGFTMVVLGLISLVAIVAAWAISEIRKSDRRGPPPTQGDTEA